MRMKVRFRRYGEHVRVQVFLGPDVEHYANCGSLCFNPDEWDAFRETLRYGQHALGNPIMVEFEESENA
jgi:hypothetical protein